MLFIEDLNFSTVAKKIDIITSFYKDFNKFNWKDECYNYIDDSYSLDFKIYRKDDSLDIDSKDVIEEDVQNDGNRNDLQCAAGFSKDTENGVADDQGEQRWNRKHRPA